jgi:NAD(P)H-dependent flavin oxidoreductase YrpB (nitropropane dioxygenase family)
MRTPICDTLGIEFPLFAFSHCRDVVAAVTNAGGFGVLGALAFSPDQLEVELSWIDEHVDGKPYGVDFAMPEKFVGKGADEFSIESLQELIPQGHRDFVEQILDEHDVPPLPDGVEGAMKAAGLGVEAEGPAQVALALTHPISMLVNALGPPPEYAVEQAHEKGVLVGALCGSPRHAERNIERGVDVLIAQGTEAGGHCGEISTMVLVPDIVDHVGPDVPVLAAGGIGRGRQMAAAMALGAQGAWTGSIWLTVAESDMQPWVIDNLLAAGPRDAVRSRSMTGKPARQLRTDWTEAWDDPETPDPLPMPLQGLLYAPAAHRFTRAQNKALSGQPVGQIVGTMNKVRPARDVVYDIVNEWIETNQKIAASLEDPV